jgi:hypothetical protein
MCIRDSFRSFFIYVERGSVPIKEITADFNPRREKVVAELVAPPPEQINESDISFLLERLSERKREDSSKVFDFTKMSAVAAPMEMTSNILGKTN